MIADANWDIERHHSSPGLRKNVATTVASESMKQHRVLCGARLLVAGILLSLAAEAIAGPPFLTDDPEPTEAGHWELYAPFTEAAGKGAEFDGSTGVEINYGAAPDLQLTLGVPIAYSHDAGGWRSGVGDLEASAKYRFFHDMRAGVQVAAFPGLSLPTARRGFGAGHVTGFLPVWAQLDRGKWGLFGGGGYAINPGAGNRDFWTGGIAATRHVTERLLVGIEADRQGADRVGGSGSTALGAGAILQLRQPLRLLASGGPTFDNAGGKAGFHAYLALGVDY